MTGSPAARNKYERTYVIVVVLAVLLPVILVILAWRASLDEAEAGARARFEFRALQIRDAISGRMLDYEQVLRGAAGLFAATRSVEREEWRRYYHSLKLEDYYPGIQGIGYAPRVTPPNTAALVATARATGYPDYEIKPAGVRDVYFPIVYLTPNTDRNLRAIGFDMYSNPVRRKAIDEAVASGRSSITRKVTLVQETAADIQAGFLMYLPVYRHGASAGDADQRRASVQGVVYAAFRAGNLISRILGDEREVEVSVFDGTATGEDALLYKTMQADVSTSQPLYEYATQILIHGHPWTLRMRSTPDFEARVDRSKPGLVLLGGILIHLLLLLVLWSLWATRQRAISLARSMTRELRHREAEWQAMSEASPLGIFRAGASGGYVYANPRYEQLSGLAEPAISGEGWLQAVHPDDRARVRDEWQAFVQGRAAEHACTYRFLHGNGTVVWVTELSAVIREEGAISGYVGSVEDVTERRNTVNALVKSRERLGMALVGSNLALFDWNIASGKVHLSEQWQLMLGGDKVDTVTTIDELQRLVHPEDLPALRQSLAPVLKGHSRFYEVQHRVRNRYGEWRWILSRAKVSERDAAGHALRMTGTNADITAGKEIERLKNEFISTVSHELRTPLTAIIGALGLMKESGASMDPDNAVFLDMAYQNSERLSTLINEVLDLEKIESGQMTLDLRPLQLRPLLERAVHMNQPYAELHQVRLRLLPGQDVTVVVEADRLMQVLSNLISNAAKFSPEGAEVDIGAELRDGVVRVSVRDRGPGIAEEFRTRIFMRFERADNSDSRRKGGTGLGLSICKALIERMNGHIGFESADGGGTVFYFELPAPGKTEAHAAADPTEGEDGR